MLPTHSSTSRASRLVTLSDHGRETRESIILDSGNTDTGSTPNDKFRAGNVCVKRASTGRYVEANDANGDRNGQASAASLIAIGAGAASKTFKWKYKGGEEQTVTLGAGDNTAALVVTALNADADFSADLIASQASNILTIKTKRSGADEYFEITDGTLNDQGGVDQDTFANNTLKIGTDAEYRVTLEFAELKDADGTAVHDEVLAARVGHFKKANLINLTAEAEATLRKWGSIFE